MNMRIVTCPNKKCGHSFSTKKEEPQCGLCGTRFILSGNIQDSRKSILINMVTAKQHKKQAKRLENLLAKLIIKYDEMGMLIKEFYRITKIDN
jgi:hypothetical protein